MTLDDLLGKMQKTNPQADLDLVREAYAFAATAHQGQVRCSGEPFINHPLQVAIILANLGLDVITISAGLLHDVVEDTEVTLEAVEKKFGQEVALLVDGVTKLTRIENKSKVEQQVENLRKMFLAMAKDIRVILIKLADRLHNMRTLKHMSEVKQKEIAQETMEIFAPLAHRLGIFRIKWELEDTAFRYLESDKYYELVQTISMKRQERESFINSIIETLQGKLKAVGIESDIDGRPKHFFSIYNKMKEQQKSLSEIYDLMAIRVIVDTIKDCYGALGIIHTLWKPLPGRFKDFIAMPKPNMYQSLHTTLMSPRGEPFEIQIRTWEMHRTAEYGIAAHWRYKEGGKSDKDFENKLSWLRQLLEWQNDMRDAREFMETLKIDLFADNVFVFTPKGDVVELPAGSVPIDFAYRVHTDVGHRCIGAKINGRIVPLDYKLVNGDIVDILTSKQARPSRDWLNIVKTSQAKNRIRAWYKKEKREENVLRGREILEKESRRQGFETAEFLKPEWLSEVTKRFAMPMVEDLYVALVEGVVATGHVIMRLKEIYQRHRQVEEAHAALSEIHQESGKAWSGYSKPSQGLRVKGVDNVLVRLARCCNPLPGDEVIGYITRGRGVSVHQRDCPNLHYHQRDEEERMIEVMWDNLAQGTYQVEIEVIALDRQRLTTDIMTAIVETKATIIAVNARPTRDKMASVNLVTEIRNLEHLNFIVGKLQRIKDVVEVHRVTPHHQSTG